MMKRRIWSETAVAERAGDRHQAQAQGAMPVDFAVLSALLAIRPTARSHQNRLLHLQGRAGAPI